MHRPCRRREREGSKKGLCVDWQPINNRLDWDKTKQPEYSPWSHDDTDMLISEIRPSWGPIASTPAATMVRSVGYGVNIYKPQNLPWYVSTNSYVGRRGCKITHIKLVWYRTQSTCMSACGIVEHCRTAHYLSSIITCSYGCRTTNRDTDHKKS